MYPSVSCGARVCQNRAVGRAAYGMMGESSRLAFDSSMPAPGGLRVSRALRSAGRRSSRVRDLGNSVGTRANTPRLVPDEQLQRYGGESPERAFLTWFRDLQRNDAEGAAGFYAKSLRVDAGQVAVDRILASGLFAVLGPPRILYRVREGDTVTICTLLPQGAGRPEREERRRPAPDGVPLGARRRAWKLTDNLFLEDRRRTDHQAAAEGGLDGRLAVAPDASRARRRLRRWRVQPRGPIPQLAALIRQSQVERYQAGSPGTGGLRVDASGGLQ